VADHPQGGDRPFASDDADLLEPGPCFERQGEWIDPAQQGYAMVHNYAAYFWRPYLGNTAFALWELLVSFCYGERDVAFPSISRLARMLTNSDHSRAVVTGRRRSPARKEPRSAKRRTQGALGVLRRERLVQVRHRGQGPTTRYTFRMLKTLPLLRPEQLARLSPRLRRDHANWLERYGIDDAAYRDAYAEQANGPPRTDGHADARGNTPSAPATGSDDHGQPPAAASSTKYLQEKNQLEEWWQHTLDSLRLQMVRSVFHTSLTNTHRLALKDGELTVRARSALQRDFLEHRLMPLVLREVAEASGGQVTGVRFLPPTARDYASPDGSQA
jgi:hypothetical protein